MHHNLQIKFQFHSPNSSINNVAGSIVIDMVRNGEHEYTLNLPTGDTVSTPTTMSTKSNGESIP
jgi:hypothetical protein